MPQKKGDPQHFEVCNAFSSFKLLCKIKINAMSKFKFKFFNVDGLDDTDLTNSACDASKKFKGEAH